MNALHFKNFFSLLFFVQQWVASIDGNVPFWPPSYVIK